MEIFVSIVFQLLIAFLFYKIGYEVRETQVENTKLSTFSCNGEQVMTVRSLEKGYFVKILDSELVTTQITNKNLNV